METALCLPIVLLALLMIVQTTLVARDALTLQLAAAQGARAASVQGDDASIREAVIAAAASLDEAGLRIESEPASGSRTRGRPVTVRLSYVERLRLPVIRNIVARTWTLRASSAMRLERPDPCATQSPAPSPSPPPSPSPAPTPGCPTPMP